MVYCLILNFIRTSVQKFLIFFWHSKDIDNCFWLAGTLNNILCKSNWFVTEYKWFFWCHLQSFNLDTAENMTTIENSCVWILEFFFKSQMIRVNVFNWCIYCIYCIYSNFIISSWPSKKPKIFSDWLSFKNLQNYTPNNFLYITNDPCAVISAGFTYRLVRLKPSASNTRESSVKVYNIFDTVIGLSYTCCHKALVSKQPFCHLPCTPFQNILPITRY